LTSRADKDSYLARSAGFDISNRYRLENIQIKSAGVVVRKYHFEYEGSPMTLRSRLKKVKECAGDADNCFLPITFSYQTGFSGVTAGSGTPPAGSSNMVVGRYDLNGDGKEDILYSTGGTCYAAFSTNNGFSSPVSTGRTTCGSVDRFLPNGRAAIIYLGSPVQVVYWNGATFVSANMSFNYTSAETVVYADHDGDGLADLAYLSGTTITTRRNTSTGSGAPSFSPTTQSSASLAGIPGASWGSIWSAFSSGLARSDFNGDGAQDINGVFSVPNGWGAIVYYVRLYGSSGGYYAGPSTNVADMTPNFPSLNFNGDNCSDVLVGTNIQISPCNAAVASSVAVPATPLQFLDWDGDGKTDFLANSGGYFSVYLSTGAGFSEPISTTIPSAGTFFSIDQDGDRLDDLIKANGALAISYWTHTAAGYVPTAYATHIPDLLLSATDGYGVNFSPNYYSTAWAAYDPGAITVSPLREARPQIVVGRVISSNGIGGTYETTYNYFGYRTNAERVHTGGPDDDGEPAGFQRIDSTDSRNGLISRTYYEQEFPRTGMVKQRQLMQPNGTNEIANVVFTNAHLPLDTLANNQRYFVYQSGSTSTEYEVGGTYNGNLLRTVATVNSYEATGGTLYDQVVTTTEPASGANGLAAGGQWITRTYLPVADLLNDTGNWCLGRPGKIQQINEHKLSYGDQITRTTNVTWSGPYCRPTQSVAEPGGPLQVITDIAYDDFGNVKSTTVNGADTLPRTTRATYSDETHTSGQFLVSTEDAESVANSRNQKTIITWDQNLGVPLSAKDPNGASTFWQYDPYGRRTGETRPDLTASTWTIIDCATFSACSEVRTFVQQKELDSSGGFLYETWNKLDRFDRSTDRSFMTLGEALGGSTHYGYEQTRYDALGRVSKSGGPIIATLWNDAYVSTYTYDLANRVTLVSRPISAANLTAQTTTISYEGLKTRVVDALQKETVRVSNAFGELVRSTDHDGYYQAFEYDAFGNVKRVSDTAGNQLQASNYNIRGMLTLRIDMDMGAWSFTPNALGEVVSQTDANGKTTTFTFDRLGRLEQRSEDEGTSTFTWGTSAADKNIGSLVTMSGPGYSENYLYDGLGRPSETTIAADDTYHINFTYNNQGRLDTLTYPASTNGCRLKLQHGYTRGLLTSITDASNAAQCNHSGTVFWTANKGDGFGRPIKETLGNGLVTNRTYDLVTGSLQSLQTGLGGGSGTENLAYEWDWVGNLTKRRDLIHSNPTEEFSYDNLHRLHESKLNGVKNLEMAYDALGNITSKSDVGTYTYHATKKHQATLIDRPGTDPDWNLAYDANGNMTSGRGTTISWTSANYPLCIRTGTDCSGTASDWAKFSYTPDRQYWKQESNYTNGGSASTIYIGGILEKVTAEGYTDFRHMIRAGGSTIIVSRQLGNETFYYQTSDHLGSSNVITNSAGGTINTASFDAFGRRRSGNWTGPVSPGDWGHIASTTRRGYTGHTMLDNLELIHMNGRVQDPVLGRFLSADPFIPDPLNTQSYNRYSYVFNTPLSWTDPSGFEPNYYPNLPPIVDPPRFPVCTAKPWLPGCEPDPEREPPDPPNDIPPAPGSGSTAQWSGLGSANAFGYFGLEQPVQDCGCSFVWIWYRMSDWNFRTLCNNTSIVGGNGANYAICALAAAEAAMMAGSRDNTGSAGPPMAGASESTTGGPGQDWDPDSSSVRSNVLNEEADSAKLGRRLESRLGSRPLDSDAHHIAAGTARRAEPARQALRRVGIGINEAENGVFLPRGVHQGGMHTNRYYDAVNRALANVQSRSEARYVLDQIAKGLKAGTFPW